MVTLLYTQLMQLTVNLHTLSFELGKNLTILVTICDTQKSNLP